MEEHTFVRPLPPTPRSDRLVMVVRRGGVVLARWALPAHAVLGQAPSSPMALPVGLGPVRELEVSLLPGDTAVRLRVVEAPSPQGARPSGAPASRVLDLGEPVRVGRCTVTFFPCATDVGASEFDRAAPTLALGPAAADVEQDLVETRLLPWNPGGAAGGDWGRLGQRVALFCATTVVRTVVAVARLSGGWLGRRCGALLREEGEALEQAMLPVTGRSGIS
jgi:hypothetical protein